MYGIVDFLRFITGNQIGDDHIGTNGDSDESQHQEIDDVTISSDSCLSLSIDEAAHNRCISRVEELLQDAGCRQRQSECDEFLSKWTIEHVHGVGLCFHGNLFFF